MTRESTPVPGTARLPVGQALDEMTASFERFCLAAGLEVLGEMLEADAAALCGPRHGRGVGRRAQRWGRTVGPIGFHGGKVAVARPRVRERGGQEVVLPSWERAVGEDWLGRWAMNLMLLGVSTRRFGRAVRLPEATCRRGRARGCRSRPPRGASSRSRRSGWRPG